MAISLSVTPTGLSGLAEASPLVFELLTAETATPVSAVLGSAPDTVVLSDTGQLLSAIATFQDDLGILQAGAAGTGPAVALTTAQNLVDTFNRLQGVVAPLAANPPATLLNEVVTAAAASLPEIGIALQTVSASNATATSSVLRIDLAAFSAALAAAPAGTQAVLSKAVEALIDLADEFAAKLAEAAAAAAAQARAALTTGTVAPTQTSAAPAAVVAVTPALTGAALPAATAPVAAPVAVPVETPLPAATQALTTSEEIDTDGSASAATLALQRLLADPARNARNNLFDPAYAWLTGAFHVSDFALPGQTIDPNAGLPDFPPPILPVAPIDGIAYYKEAAEDTRSRVVRHVNHLV